MGLKRIEKPSLPVNTSALSHILYVEDEDSNWAVTELQLRGKHYLKRARDSAEAFHLLARERFDLILLDIQLRGSELDGIQICKRIRGHANTKNGPTILQADTPIVFVTAYTARYDRSSLLAAGGDEVVSKPVDYTRLLLVSSRLILRGLKGSA